VSVIALYFSDLDAAEIGGLLLLVLLVGLPLLRWSDRREAARHWHPEEEAEQEEATQEALWIEPPACPVCPSGEGVLLGTLGPLAWFRCRDCGIEFNPGKGETRW
jgi:hypothetical protein